MSTISPSATQSDIRTGCLVSAAWRTIKAMWAAYMVWRVQQLAVSRLKSMSDRELKDIGIARSQIDAAVRGHLAKDPLYRQY